MGRPRKGTGTPSSGRNPTTRQIEDFAKRLDEAGEAPALTEDGFRGWLKRACEKELWFLSRWILDNDFLAEGNFHREKVCPFLTNFHESRRKLLMLPMGHLKTTVASRSMPLHVLIQPGGQHNRYFKGKLGQNCRIALANETQEKSRENLNYIKTHCENNEWLYWLWPDIFFENPKSQANRWSDTFIEVKRTEVWAEASITALGVNTGFVGRYYDMIIPDDIAALAASQSSPVLERAKKFRRAMHTRLTNKELGIIVGVGTEWPAVDLYAEWEQDPNTQVMVHSIIEEDPLTKEDVPLWPEKYPLELIEQMRASNDAIEWAAWYMNKRVGRGVTALDWHLLREYTVTDDGKFLEFAEAEEDGAIVLRKERIHRNLGFNLSVSRYDPMQAKPRAKAPRGMDNDYFSYLREKYPEKIKEEDGSNHNA